MTSTEINPNNIYTTTISELRALQDPDPNAIYYITDMKQQGAFYYDANDIASTDNTGTILVSAMGARFKRIFNGIYELDWFGAKGDSVTDDTEAIIRADETANGGIIVFNKVYHYSQSGYSLKSQFIGSGSFTNYTGAYSQTFSGSGVNDVIISGEYICGYNLTIDVEVFGTPDNWRFTSDGGNTWVSEEVTIIDDIPQITPLKITTNPQPLGATGLLIHWNSTNGHIINDRWTIKTDQVLKRIDVNGLDYRGEPLFREGSLRSIGFGRNVFTSAHSISTDNVAFGVNVMPKNVIGFANAAYGNKVLEENTTGAYNSAFGVYTLQANTSGQVNCAFGTYSMGDNLTGAGNAGYASDTLRYNKDGDRNTAVGTQSLYHNISGLDNTTVGYAALRGGDESLSNGKSVYYNTAIGAYALFYGAPEYSTAVGHEALYRATGSNNVGIGARSGMLLEDGELNTFVGLEAGLGEPHVQAPNTNGSVCIGAYTASLGDDGVAIGRDAVAGAGEIALGGVHNQNGIYYYGDLIPRTDGTQSVGKPTNRLNTMYTASDAISNADAREMTPVEPLSDAEHNVANELRQHIGKYKQNDAVSQKGDKARWHFGIDAQTVKDIFAKYGLDGFDYGVLCYDEWDNEYIDYPEEKDNDGNTVKPARRELSMPSGSRFAVRYGELTMFLLASI